MPEPELAIEMRHRVEGRTLVFHFTGLGRGEEVDDKRRRRALAHPGRLLFHVGGLRIGEAEAAERARGRACGDELLAARAAGHRRLHYRNANAKPGGEGGGDHAVSVKSSRPISQRRISEVPAPIS
jgi:hypothetical protein